MCCCVVQLLSCVQLFMTPCRAACQASLSSIIPWSLLKLLSIDSVMPSNHLILCCPLFSCPQSFPESGSFPVSGLFASGGKSIEASASASVLPVNIQDWFPLELTGLISLQSKGLYKEFSPTSQFKSINSLVLFMVQLSHPYLTTEKTIALTIQTFVGKVMSLLFNILSRFVIAFLPRS